MKYEKTIYYKFTEATTTKQQQRRIKNKRRNYGHWYVKFSKWHFVYFISYFFSQMDLHSQNTFIWFAHQYFYSSFHMENRFKEFTSHSNLREKKNMNKTAK